MAQKAPAAMFPECRISIAEHNTARRLRAPAVLILRLNLEESVDGLECDDAEENHYMDFK